MGWVEEWKCETAGRRSRKDQCRRGKKWGWSEGKVAGSSSGSSLGFNHKKEGEREVWQKQHTVYKRRKKETKKAKRMGTNIRQCFWENLQCIAFVFVAFPIEIHTLLVNYSRQWQRTKTVLKDKDERNAHRLSTKERRCDCFALRIHYVYRHALTYIMCAFPKAASPTLLMFSPIIEQMQKLMCFPSSFQLDNNGPERLLFAPNTT